MTTWIFNLEKSISKGFTGSKNPVRQAWFFKIDFSKIKFRSTGGKGLSQTRNRSSKITTYLQILPRPTANPNIDRNPSQGLLHFALSGSSDVWTLKQELLVPAWAYFCMPICWKTSATEITVLDWDHYESWSDSTSVFWQFWTFRH